MYIKQSAITGFEKMNNDTPRLSVGLPVFNGEKYLRQAIDSILNQTYQNFELIISDNASTDRTREICIEYLTKDSRIRYYRSRRNRGAAWNWNRVFKLSSGEYFKWVAHDDTMVPEFFSKCIYVLEQDPSIILCHSKNAIINECDKLVGKYNLGTFINSEKPHKRLNQILKKIGVPWLIFGVFRRDMLDKTPVFQGYIGSDWNLLAEVSLIGQIFEIQEYLFYRRDHKESYTDSHYSKPVRVHDFRTESLWWTGNTKPPRIILPRWQNFIEFIKSINRVPMARFERYLSYQEIIRWLLRKGFQMMKWDLFNEIELWRIKLIYGKQNKGSTKSM